MPHTIWLWESPTARALSRCAGEAPAGAVAATVRLEVNATYDNGTRAFRVLLDRDDRARMRLVV